MAQKVMLPHEPKTQSFDLLSGHSIPAIGLGTWKSGSEAINSVKTAIVDVTNFHLCISYIQQHILGSLYCCYYYYS
jgi:aldehyde reductase